MVIDVVEDRDAGRGRERLITVHSVDKNEVSLGRHPTSAASLCLHAAPIGTRRSQQLEFDAWWLVTERAKHTSLFETAFSRPISNTHSAFMNRAG